jgi:hypothetical protein
MSILSCQIPLFLCPALAHASQTAARYASKTAAKAAKASAPLDPLEIAFRHNARQAPATMLRKRLHVHTEDSADQIVKSWGLERRKTPVTVIEMFAGGLVPQEDSICGP